jgi:hypothetical protein
MEVVVAQQHVIRVAINRKNRRGFWLGGDIGKSLWLSQNTRGGDSSSDAALP